MQYNFISFILSINSDNHLLYSCISPTASLSLRPISKMPMHEDEFYKLYVLSARISEQSLTEINKQIIENNILGDFFDNNTFNILMSRCFIQIDENSALNNSRRSEFCPESISGVTSKVKTYYTESYSFLSLLIESFTAKEKSHFKEKILKRIEEHIGLKFTSSYLLRIGCLEIFEPIKEIYPYVFKNSKGIKISRPQETKEHFFAHITLRSGEEIVTDKLYSIDSDELTENINDSFNNSEITIFDRNGNLIHKEHHNYIESIVVNMELMSGQRIFIDDKLTKSLDDKKEQINAREVDRHMMRNPIVIEHDKSIYKANKRRLLEQFYFQDSELKGGFFNKDQNISEKGKAFTWLINLINSSSHVTIIDPYFSSKVVIESFRRIRSDVSVHVVTSLEKKGGFNEQDTLDGCKQSLIDFGGDILCKLKIENHTKPNGKKLFHDRFFIIYNGDKFKVYMLSNSLSAYCESFPFTYMPLDTETAEKVISFFENWTKDRNIEILWDSTALPEKTNSIENYAYASKLILQSNWFSKGIGLILNEPLLHEQKINPENSKLSDTTRNLIQMEEIGFKSNLDVLIYLFKTNIEQKEDDFSDEEIGILLLTLGELLARCHSEDFLDVLVSWLSKYKLRIQNIFNIICEITGNSINDDKNSSDISLPKISTNFQYFQFFESAFGYGLRYIAHHWGLYYSSKLLIHIGNFSLPKDLNSNTQLINIFSGILNNLPVHKDFFNHTVCNNLLSSEQELFQIFGIVYLKEVGQELNKALERLEAYKIKNELIIYFLAIKYKSLIHSYYRNQLNKRINSDEIERMEEISVKVALYWDNCSLSDGLLQEIYICFINKYEFAYKFASKLTNRTEQEKFYKIILGKLAQDYGWVKELNNEVWISDNNLEDISWAAKAYYSIYSKEIMNGLKKWNRDFIEPAKQLLMTPFNNKNSKNLSDRFATLLYFVSEVSLINQNQITEKNKNIIIHLFNHTKDLFESEKKFIFSVNENIYHKLLANLVQLLIYNGKLQKPSNIGQIFFFSDYLITASDNLDYLIENSGFHLNRLLKSRRKPIFILLTWFFLVGLNCQSQQKSISSEIIKLFEKVIENMQIFDENIQNYTTDLIKLFKGEISDIRISYENVDYTVCYNAN